MAMSEVKTPYKAAFVLPSGATKALGENGWEFASEKHLPTSTKDFFVAAFKLKPLESYLGIESYEGDNMKMSVIYDDRHLIESIYFQLRGDTLAALEDHFNAHQSARSCELFVPEKV